MEPIKINVEKNDKCYFCGRNKNEVLLIIDDMKNGIDEAISSIEKEIKGLSVKFEKEEEVILKSMNKIDLSYKIKTIITDSERFRKEIPLFDLWTNEIKQRLNVENQKNKRSPGIKKIEPMFEKNDYEVTIADVMKSLNFYLTLKKEESKKELEEELLELQEIKESFIEHKLKPLVNMTSKPLGKITQNWKLFNAHKQRNPYSGDANGPVKFDMKARVDNVGFVLTTCHFCYDRFQGSTN